MSARDLIFLLVGIAVGSGLVLIALTWKTPDRERRCPRAAQRTVLTGGNRRNDHKHRS